MSDTITTTSMLKPNRIDTPSAAKIQALEHNIPVAPTPPDRELRAKAIRLQLRSVQIMNGLQGLWGTDIGAATGVYLIMTVVDGMSDQPIVFQGKTYQGVENGDMLPLGPGHEAGAVFNVYLREGELPRVLSFSLLVLRSNQELRDLGNIFTKLQSDDRYKDLSKIVTAAVTGANPILGTVWQASEAIIGLVGEYLKAKPDDQLGYYQANFTNAFDNLGVGRHPADEPTMPVDRIRFAYEVNALAD